MSKIVCSKTKLLAYYPCRFSLTLSRYFYWQMMGLSQRQRTYFFNLGANDARSVVATTPPDRAEAVAPVSEQSRGPGRFCRCRRHWHQMTPANRAPRRFSSPGLAACRPPPVARPDWGSIRRPAEVTGTGSGRSCGRLVRPNDGQRPPLS